MSIRVDWLSRPRPVASNPMAKVFGHGQTVNYSLESRGELRAKLANPTMTRGARAQVRRQLGLAYSA